MFKILSIIIYLNDSNKYLVSNDNKNNNKNIYIMDECQKLSIKELNPIDTRTTDGDYNELTSLESFYNLCNRQCVFVCYKTGYTSAAVQSFNASPLPFFTDNNQQ